MGLVMSRESSKYQSSRSRTTFRLFPFSNNRIYTSEGGDSVVKSSLVQKSFVRPILRQLFPIKVRKSILKNTDKIAARHTKVLHVRFRDLSKESHRFLIFFEKNRW